ncbi:MAG: HAD family hydrolase [Tumebacillaceae bacterium]
MKKLLLWDIDGTLMMSKGVGKRAMDRAFLELYGVERAFDGIGMAGGLDLHFIDEAFIKNGMEVPSDLEPFLAAYAQALTEELPGEQTYMAPGVVETLERAERDERYFNALGTGNVERGARIKLDLFDLNRFFPVGGFCEDRVERYEMLQAGVENCKRYFGVDFAPDDVIVIGDTVKDIVAARKIGAKVIAVSTGGHSYEMLEAAQPDLLVKTLEEQAFVDYLFGDR